MAATESKESPANNPGLHATVDEATKGYFMQQTVSLFPIHIYNSTYCMFGLINNNLINFMY